MARRLLQHIDRQLEPYVDRITEHPWIRRYAPALAAPDLWHLNRRSSARAVAIGLFAGLIPGPLQVLGAVGLSIVFRAYFPLAAITTLYTNPFTIVPLYILAYQYGSLFTGGNGDSSFLHPPDFAWSLSYAYALAHWAGQLGKPLVLGLVLLAFTLAALGWLAVRVCWRCQATRAWHKRAARRHDPRGTDLSPP